MAFLKTVAACFLLCVACAASASPDRRLLAQQSVSTCLWDGDTTQCRVNPTSLLSLTASDDIGKLAQQVAATTYICTALTSTTCEDREGCIWNPSTEQCIWDHTNIYSMLLCPGSKAALVVNCAIHGDNETLCVAHTDCAWANLTNSKAAIATKSMARGGTSTAPSVSESARAAQTDGGDDGMVCIPKSINTPEGVAELLSYELQDSMNYDNTTLWGSCAGLKILAGISSACNFSTETACHGAKFCQWSGSVDSESGACYFKSYGEPDYLFASSSGVFDTTVEGYITSCNAASNETDCTAASTQVKFDDTVVTSALSYNQAGNNTSKSAGSSLSPVMHLSVLIAVVMLLLVLV